jgi:hypothetical protein
MSTIKQQAAAARRAGQTAFIADKPCKRGHRARDARNGYCIQCVELHHWCENKGPAPVGLLGRKPFRAG